MRDKLVELIQHEVVPYFAERIADHLIANGVTVQEWISPIEYYPHKNEIILIHDTRGNTYVGPSINTPVGKVGYWMPLPEAPKGE